MAWVGLGRDPLPSFAEILSLEPYQVFFVDPEHLPLEGTLPPQPKPVTSIL